MKPLILGLAGESLSADEATLFRAVEPAGYILFGHNVSNPEQLGGLTDSLRALSGNAALPILIDQEGGRVARLKPYQWPHFPAGRAFAALYDLAPMTAIEAMRVNAEAIGLTLAEAGITVNCMPVLDLLHADTSAAIADRCLSARARGVAALGRAALDGLRSAGIVGVVKHMPGQGRASADSHAALPIVTASEAELADDLLPFAALADARIGMVGHVVYTAWDDAAPASQSALVIDNIIRGRIGFDGLLLSDDLHMDALSGDIGTRANAVLAAGCDLALACWVGGDDVRALADALPDIMQTARDRLDRAMSFIGTEPAKAVDKLPALIAKRDALLAYAV